MFEKNCQLKPVQTDCVTVLHLWFSVIHDTCPVRSEKTFGNDLSCSFTHIALSSQLPLFAKYIHSNFKRFLKSQSNVFELIVVLSMFMKSHFWNMHTRGRIKHSLSLVM